MPEVIPEDLLVWEGLLERQGAAEAHTGGHWWQPYLGASYAGLGGPHRGTLPLAHSSQEVFFFFFGYVGSSLLCTGFL